MGFFGGSPQWKQKSKGGARHGAEEDGSKESNDRQKEQQEKVVRREK